MSTRLRAQLELGLAAIACAVVGWLVWDRLATSAWFFADDWAYFRQFVSTGYALQLGELVPWATSRPRALHRTLMTLLFLQFGFESDVYHHIQLGIHVLTTILLFALVRRLVSYAPAAWMAAAVFLLNRFTLHTVSWISLLHDNLTACLSVVVLLCYGRSWQPGARGWVWFACTALAFSLGLKAKEGFVTLPIVVVLFTALFGRPSERAVLVEGVKIAVLLAIAGVFYLSAPTFPPQSPLGPYFQSFHPAVISRSLWWYAAHIVFLPASILTWLVNLPAPASVAGIAALIVTPLAAVAIPGPAGRTLAFGWMMLWLGLLPTATLPNHYAYKYYVYTPMVGAAIAFGGAIALAEALISHGRTRRIAMAAVLATASALIAASYAATRALPEMSWYSGIGTESKRVMERLTEALPSMPRRGHIVLVGVRDASPFRWVRWYDAGPSAVIQSWYRDSTLKVTLVDDERGATADQAAPAGRSTIVLVWTGERFVPKHATLADHSPVVGVPQVHRSGSGGDARAATPGL